MHVLWEPLGPSRPEGRKEAAGGRQNGIHSGNGGTTGKLTG
jgi:hypothetical protein